MLDVLEQHLNPRPKLQVCVIGAWILTLSEKEQEAFQKIIENSASVNVAKLFSDLKKQTNLVFKLTAFRSHIRGYCTCQK